MSKQFTKLGGGNTNANSGSSVPQQSLHFGYPHHFGQPSSTQVKPRVDILMEEDDCSKDLSNYINSIDELMGKMF